MNRTRVLVFPCGSENATEIHQALRYSVHVEVYGASSVDDHGRFRFARYHGGLPNISDPGFDSAFGALIRELGIDVVFATHDTVLAYLAKRAESMGFFLVNGNDAAATMVRSKRLTYAAFADTGWAPGVYGAPDSVDVWPAIVKPDQGQGGQGVIKVQNTAEARDALARGEEESLLVEYLPGAELTVDCFTDAQRELVWVGPRTRERVRAGISMRCKLLEADEEILAIAGCINERVVLRGPWFFQVKKDRRGRFKLLEISGRVAGSMVAQRARGVNLPLMAIHDFLGRKLKALPNGAVGLIDRSIVTRADLDVTYHTVCVDLDDTLIINGAGVPAVLAFLYQAVAAGKRIVLITRHEFTVRDTLRKARIAESLFDRIVHLTNGESKADYVEPGSIFIDNFFPDRLDVAARTGVPVLDVDAVEFFVR